ncbi:hypothetical protein JQ569_35695 [Bradyrhizobium elkanii]|nr:hypothetical protein [Bradyrhizobium elkanii]
MSLDLLILSDSTAFDVGGSHSKESPSAQAWISPQSLLECLPIRDEFVEVHRLVLWPLSLR